MVFKEGPSITASDSLWAEFQACMRLGLDPSVEFAKDRFSRMLNTGGIIADSAVNAMRSYDMAKDREAEAERKRR